MRDRDAFQTPLSLYVLTTQALSGIVHVQRRPIGGAQDRIDGEVHDEAIL
jgi:hypothetical protein